MKLIARRLKKDIVKLVIATLVLLTAAAAYAEPLPVPVREAGGEIPPAYSPVLNQTNKNARGLESSAGRYQTAQSRPISRCGLL
jgi:hypothetical protein